MKVKITKTSIFGFPVENREVILETKKDIDEYAKTVTQEKKELFEDLSFHTKSLLYSVGAVFLVFMVLIIIGELI